MQVNLKTMFDYYGFRREVCYVIVTNNDNVIGGEGKIVQIYESHMYTRRRVLRTRRLKLVTNNWQYSASNIKTDNDKKCVKKKERGRHLPGYWQ